MRMGSRPTHLVEQLRAALAGRSDIEIAMLFGSRARGDEHEGSDVDLAVRGRDLDTAALAGALSEILGLEVDVVSLADPGIPLLQRLIDEAIVVHEGVAGAGASWRTATLLALEIDGPWYRRMRDAFLARVADRGV